MTSSAESDLRRPARTLHQSCVPGWSRFDGHCMESATHAIRDCPQHKRDLTEHLTLPHSCAKSEQGCRSRYDGAPPLALQQAFTGQLQPTQARTNATNYPAGVRTIIPNVASARYCYKSSLSSQPESTAPWYHAWPCMRPHRCHSQAAATPTDSGCSVGASSEVARWTRSFYVVLQTMPQQVVSMHSQVCKPTTVWLEPTHIAPCCHCKHHMRT